MSLGDSDQWGKTVCLKAINWFLEGYSIKHTVSVLYHPKSNVMAKKTIQTLKGIMAKLRLRNIKEWMEHVNIAVTAYWLIPHQATGFSLL